MVCHIFNSDTWQKKIVCDILSDMSLACLTHLYILAIKGFSDITPCFHTYIFWLLAVIIYTNAISNIYITYNEHVVYMPILFLFDLLISLLLLEGQVIQTDSTNILIRHLQLNKQKSDAKDSGSRTPGENTRGKR